MSILELQSLDAAVARDPGSAAALRQRAAWYDFEGMVDEAAADYEAALRLEPGDEESRCRLAICRLRQGRAGGEA